MAIIEGGNIRIRLEVFVRAEHRKGFNGSIADNARFGISAPLVHDSNEILILEVGDSLSDFRSVDSSVKVPIK
jgi:hypothetical protein